MGCGEAESLHAFLARLGQPQLFDVLADEALTPALLQSMRPDLLQAALSELGLTRREIEAVLTGCGSPSQAVRATQAVRPPVQCCWSIVQRERLSNGPVAPPPPLPPNSRHLPIDPYYPRLQRVHACPPVYLIDDFLPASECELLLRMGPPLLLQSRTDGGVSQGRTSTSVFLDRGCAPCPSLLSRLAALTGRPTSHMERPQLARYRHGQRYVAHYDTPTLGPDLAAQGSAGAGLRICTVLVYLCSVAEDAGGATFFPRLGLRVQPRRGCALVFFPATEDGHPDPDSLHAALPVLGGLPVGPGSGQDVDTESPPAGGTAEEKWVCTVWVRQRADEEDEPLRGGGEAVGALGQALLSGLHGGGLG
jgi:prolyl 4-hydroxylase